MMRHCGGEGGCSLRSAAVSGSQEAYWFHRCSTECLWVEISLSGGTNKRLGTVGQRRLNLASALSCRLQPFRTGWSVYRSRLCIIKVSLHLSDRLLFCFLLKSASTAVEERRYEIQGYWVESHSCFSGNNSISVTRGRDRRQESCRPQEKVAPL